MHFGKYVSQWRIEVDESIMGDSIFCCGVGMNFTKNRTQIPETKNNVLPKYQGNSYNFEDLPKAMSWMMDKLNELVQTQFILG
mgnify:CR=1 FL=1